MLSLRIPLRVLTCHLLDAVGLKADEGHGGAMNDGSSGNGTPLHLAADQLRRMAGIEATPVPCKGGGPLLTALLGLQLDRAFMGLTQLLPHQKSGALRALAPRGARRHGRWPALPTLPEAGVPGSEYNSRTGIAAPAGTPPGVVDRLNKAINRIATGDERRHFFSQKGSDAGERSPAEFGTFMRAEHTTFGRLIRNAGLRAE